MKKACYTLAILACLINCPAAAQQGGATEKTTPKGYLRLGVGYGFVHAGMTNFDYMPLNGSSTTTVTPGSDHYKATVDKYSFGAGLNAALAGGFMLHRNFGLELGLMGIPTSQKFKSRAEARFLSGTQTSNFTSFARPSIALIPALVFRLPGRHFDAYARVGLVVPVAEKVMIEGEHTSPGWITRETMEVKNYFSLGTAGAVGIRYHLSRRLGLFLEANGISRNAYVKTIEITEYTQNGVDRLSTLPDDERFVELDFDAEHHFFSQQRWEVSFPAAFSNIGLALGVTFGL